ncbi:unnamed protein product [Staurois parvus]|uniref:Cytochrome b n=1 Tax=Staurois parvus TaxID=386267 RepID=A0ABN9GFL6_9NEOB|nr:unnamed protein product [Staurois parvus]
MSRKSRIQTLWASLPSKLHPP